MLHHHHIIPKAALMKNKGALRYVEEKEPEILMAWVCARHHDKLSGLAHTKYGKALLIYGRCLIWGTNHVGFILEELQLQFKGPRPELGLEAILIAGRR